MQVNDLYKNKWVVNDIVSAQKTVEYNAEAGLSARVRGCAAELVLDEHLALAHAADERRHSESALGGGCLVERLVGCRVAADPRTPAAVLTKRVQGAPPRHSMRALDVRRRRRRRRIER